MRHPLRFGIAALLAGAYIGVGVVLLLSVGGPLADVGSGFTKLVGGAVFGVAPTLVVFAGAELVTSTMITAAQGVATSAISFRGAGITVIVTFVANFLGAFMSAGLVVVSGVLHINAPAGVLIADLLEAKASESTVELLARGILCNVLVCLEAETCCCGLLRHGRRSRLRRRPACPR